MAVIEAFGFKHAGIKREDFLQVDHVIQLGGEPNRIDILIGISGVSFDEAWANRGPAKIDDAAVFIISRDLLIKNKRAANRDKTAEISAFWRELGLHVVSKSNNLTRPRPQLAPEGVSFYTPRGVKKNTFLIVRLASYFHLSYQLNHLAILFSAGITVAQLEIGHDSPLRRRELRVSVWKIG